MKNMSSMLNKISLALSLLLFCGMAEAATKTITIGPRADIIVPPTINPMCLLPNGTIGHCVFPLTPVPAPTPVAPPPEPVVVPAPIPVPVIPPATLGKCAGMTQIQCNALMAQKARELGVIIQFLLAD